MDDSKTQQTDNVLTGHHAATNNGDSQGGLTLPPAERGSDNDEDHNQDGFQTFVLGYN